jgi:hypothetical protein
MRNLMLALLVGGLLSGCGSPPASTTTSQAPPTPSTSPPPAPAVSVPLQKSSKELPETGRQRANGSVQGSGVEMKDEKDPVDKAEGGTLPRPGTSATPAHGR